MKGRGISHGAISIITAFASGKGCALGIDLPVEVTVAFERGIFKKKTFLDHCIAAVFEAVSVEMEYVPHLTIDSRVPRSRGLKSSSAVANATICATLDALDKHLHDEEILRLNASISKQVGISITGSLDDAAASLWGGVVFTDNLHNKIVKREQFPENVKAVLYIPEEIRSSLDVRPLMDTVQRYGPIMDSIFTLACNGNIYEAMTLNGLVYSSLFGYPSDKITEAINAGAEGASLSGKGSAVAALVPPARIDDVVAAWGTEQVRVVDVEKGRL
ncbi:MAG: shikimate kinase [Candidatus Thorarchaeota archaeon]